jgi:nicotinate-nucleotide adenylyltransferase
MQTNPSLAVAQRIGILGGTFDPVHWGHLLIAEAARSQAMLDVVLWVPTMYPHHKAHNQPSPFVHRLAMVQQAIADHPHFIVSSVEGGQTGQSFAFNILTALQAQYPDRTWFWILGQDTIQTLPNWYRCQDLVSRCHWLVAPRKTSTALVPPELTTLRWQPLQIPQVDVSSSLIRQHLQQSYSIRYLVPDAVRAYITNHHLYM